jgi:hypothetical protein
MQPGVFAVQTNLPSVSAPYDGSFAPENIQEKQTSLAGSLRNRKQLNLVAPEASHDAYSSSICAAVQAPGCGAFGGRHCGFQSAAK